MIKRAGFVGYTYSTCCIRLIVIHVCVYLLGPFVNPTHHPQKKKDFASVLVTSPGGPNDSFWGRSGS